MSGIEIGILVAQGAATGVAAVATNKVTDKCYQKKAAKVIAKKNITDNEEVIKVAKKYHVLSKITSGVLVALEATGIAVGTAGCLDAIEDTAATTEE